MGALAQLALKVSPATFARKAGYVLDDWQLDVLTSSRNTLLNCCRQSGKTTVGALCVAKEVICEQDAMVVIASRKEDQSKLMFSQFASIYRTLQRWAPEPVTWSSVLFELANGNKVVALPGGEDAVRGQSRVTLLLTDESAFMPAGLYANLSITQAVAPRKRQICMSTPNGRQGWWYDLVRDHRKLGWDYHERTASQCPRIDRAWLEQERYKIGPMRYAQEFECQFLDAEGSAFDSHDVEASWKEYDVWTGLPRFT